MSSRRHSLSELGGATGRVDDVSEQDARENPVPLGHRARAGQELFDLVEDLVRVLGPPEVIGARDLHQPGAVDVLGHVVTMCQRDHAVPGPVQHQGRRVHQWKGRPDVDLHVRGQEGHRRPGARGKALHARERLPRAGIGGDARRPGAQADTGPPVRLEVLRELIELLGGYPDRVVGT